jgi:hypothetical protein
MRTAGLASDPPTTTGALDVTPPHVATILSATTSAVVAQNPSSGTMRPKTPQQRILHDPQPLPKG